MALLNVLRVSKGRCSTLFAACLDRVFPLWHDGAESRLLEHISKISTEDEEDRSKLNKAQVVAEFVVESDQDATVVLQMGKEALDLPTTLVTTQLTPILRLRFFTVTLVRRNQFNVTLIQETFIEWIRVIGFVRNQSLWRLIDQQGI